jgi:uncharacterized protein YbcI
MPEESPRSAGGALLTELSNSMVALHRDHFGRGPAAAKSFLLDDMVVCILTDVYTQVEKTLIRAGKGEHVRDTRVMHQYALEDEFKRRVEELTGRRVATFISTVNIDPDLAVEIFILAGED